MEPLPIFLEHNLALVPFAHLALDEAADPPVAKGGDHRGHHELDDQDGHPIDLSHLAHPCLRVCVGPNLIAELSTEIVVERSGEDSNGQCARIAQDPDSNGNTDGSREVDHLNNFG